MNVKEFENKRWQKEDQKIFFRHRMALRAIQSGTILDLGCGDGLLLRLLKEKNIKGKGLDLSEQGILKAREKDLDVDVFDFNHTLPFSDNSFDNVTILDVLEHLYDPQAVLNEAARVARDQIIIGIPNFNSLPARLQAIWGRVPENNLPKKGHIYWFNEKVLKDMISTSGLSVEKIYSNTMFESRPITGKIMKFLLKLRPSLFALSFVVVARK